VNIIEFPNDDVTLVDEVMLTMTNILQGINYFVSITEESNLNVPITLIEAMLNNKTAIEKIIENTKNKRDEV
jgi:hypothetical protein